jgi:hypothetical protein
MGSTLNHALLGHFVKVLLQMLDQEYVAAKVSGSSAKEAPKFSRVGRRLYSSGRMEDQNY